MSECHKIFYEIYTRTVYVSLGIVLIVFANTNFPSVFNGWTMRPRLATELEEPRPELNDYANSIFYALFAAVFAGLLTYIIRSKIEPVSTATLILIHIIVDGGLFAFAISQVTK